MERELGISLFERTSRQVQLTSAGEALLARAERILAEVEWARLEMQQYSGLERGRVVIGALQSLEAFRFPALLARFHTRYQVISILPRSVAEATGKAVSLISLNPPPLRTLLLAWHANVYHSPAATAFLSFIREDIHEHPWRENA